jgi:hypothetical protein
MRSVHRYAIPTLLVGTVVLGGTLALTARADTPPSTPSPAPAAPPADTSKAPAAKVVGTSNVVHRKPEKQYPGTTPQSSK